MVEKKQTQPFIKETSHVLFIDNQGNAKLACIIPKQTTNLFKKNILHDDLVGQPFNSEFDYTPDGKTKYVGPITAESFKSLAEEILDVEPEVVVTNKDLYDTNTAQQLTAEQISELQKTGVVGKGLVREIIKNSSTYDKKTVYSQAKYIKKKEKKYIRKIFVYSPTALLLAQHYLTYSPEKIGNIRFDTLALMLHVGDVQPGNRIIINESVSGLLLTAAAERMGGHGIIQYIFDDGKTNVEILSKLNVFSNIKKNIIMTSMGLLLAKPEKMAAIALLNAALNSSVGSAQGLLIANLKYHPIELLKVLWKLLAKSGAFAIYHQYLQVLVETEAFMKENKIALYLHLEELWLRQYQVLKDRTHPMMKNEQAAGGYLLYGYKISELS